MDAIGYRLLNTKISAPPNMVNGAHSNIRYSVCNRPQNAAIYAVC